MFQQTYKQKWISQSKVIVFGKLHRNILEFRSKFRLIICFSICSEMLSLWWHKVNMQHTISQQMFDKSAKYICNIDCGLKKCIDFWAKVDWWKISQFMLEVSMYRITREYFSRKPLFFKSVKYRKFQIVVALIFLLCKWKLEYFPH